MLDPISPYVYCGIHRITNEIYYGVRYGNVRLRRSPEEDLGTKYFTSSKFVKNRFNEFDWFVVAQFINKEAALEFEEFLIKESWNNPLLVNKQCAGKNFRRPDNYIRGSARKVGNRSESVKRNWKDPIFREKMIKSRQQTHTTAKFKEKHSRVMREVSQQSKDLCRVCRLSDRKEMTVQNFSRYPV